MPGRNDSSGKAAGGGWWLAVRQLIGAVAAVGGLACAAIAQQAADPAVAQLLRELHAWEDQPLTMARAQAQAGDPAAARATLQGALAQAKEARGLLAIEEIQAEMGDGEAALKTLLLARNSALAAPPPAPPNGDGRFEGDIPDPDPELDARVAKRQIPKALTDVAREQFRLGDRAAAEETFQQALRLARALVPEDRRSAIVGVITTRAEAGDFDAALNDVAAIANPLERFEALSQLPATKDLKVLERIVRMIDAAGVPPDLPPDSFLIKAHVIGMKPEYLTSLALAQDAANDRAEARKSLQRARQAAEAMAEDDYRHGELADIAWAMVKLGDAAEASRLANAIGPTEQNWKFVLLSGIAQVLVWNRDPASGQAGADALRAAETDIKKVRFLFKIAEAHREVGDRAATLRTLEQALATMRSMDQVELERGGFLGRNGAIGELALARADAGDVIGAIGLANTIERIQLRGHFLAVIAAAQAKSGDIKGAFETTATIRPPDPQQGFMTDLWDQTNALQAIITAQARAGDVAGAFTTVDRLGPSPGWRRNGLRWMAEGLGERNQTMKRAEPHQGP